LSERTAARKVCIAKKKSGEEDQPPATKSPKWALTKEQKPLQKSPSKSALSPSVFAFKKGGPQGGGKGRDKRNRERQKKDGQIKEIKKNE